MPGACAALAVPAEVQCQQRVQNTRPSHESDAAASLLCSLCRLSPSAKLTLGLLARLHAPDKAPAARHGCSPAPSAAA